MQQEYDPHNRFGGPIVRLSIRPSSPGRVRPRTITGKMFAYTLLGFYGQHIYSAAMYCNSHNIILSLEEKSKQRKITVSLPVPPTERLDYKWIRTVAAKIASEYNVQEGRAYRHFPDLLLLEDLVATAAAEHRAIKGERGIYLN